jgi:hypothetical protein
VVIFIIAKGERLELKFVVKGARHYRWLFSPLQSLKLTTNATDGNNPINIRLANHHTDTLVISGVSVDHSGYYQAVAEKSFSRNYRIVSSCVMNVKVSSVLKAKATQHHKPSGEGDLILEKFSFVMIGASQTPHLVLFFNHPIGVDDDFSHVPSRLAITAHEDATDFESCISERKTKRIRKNSSDPKKRPYLCLDQYRNPTRLEYSPYIVAYPLLAADLSEIDELVKRAQKLLEFTEGRTGLFLRAESGLVSTAAFSSRETSKLLEYTDGQSRYPWFCSFNICSESTMCSLRLVYFFSMKFFFPFP